jgi:hypothetical protein
LPAILTTGIGPQLRGSSRYGAGVLHSLCEASGRMLCWLCYGLFSHVRILHILCHLSLRGPLGFEVKLNGSLRGRGEAKHSLLQRKNQKSWRADFPETGHRFEGDDCGW